MLVDLPPRSWSIGVPLALAALLVDEEVEAVQERASWVVANPQFPVDGSGRRYPWPLV